MFIGHPDAGWKSAFVYSIVGSCKLLGVNPESYLNWALPRLAASTNHSCCDLQPHDYLKALKELPQPPGALVASSVPLGPMTRLLSSRSAAQA